jgi:hypothetical protein
VIREEVEEEVEDGVAEVVVGLFGFLFADH